MEHVAAKLKCPHDRCGILFDGNEVHDHVMECPHGPCACTHPDCDFAASPVDLVGHLLHTHSISAIFFPYGKDCLLVQLPVPATGEPRRQIIGYGRDGSVFALHIDARDTDTIVSFVCVRSAACFSPWHRVKIWAHGPPLPGPPNLNAENSLHKVEAVFEPTSSPTPGTVALEEVTSFLSVPSRYLSGCEPSKKLSIWFRIHPE